MQQVEMCVVLEYPPPASGILKGPGGWSNLGVSVWLSHQVYFPKGLVPEWVTSTSTALGAITPPEDPKLIALCVNNCEMVEVISWARGRWQPLLWLMVSSITVHVAVGYITIYHPHSMGFCASKAHLRMV